VPDPGQDVTLCHDVDAQPIRDATGLELEADKQASDEALDRRHVPPILHQNVEREDMLVTARQRQCTSPLILSYTSSICQVPPKANASS
jgi:hypothetical protein